MPTVLLTTYECRTYRLPRLCAKCAEPTDDGVPFPLVSRGIYVLLNFFLVLCPPVLVLLAVTVLRQRTFLLPLCRPHRADWEWRDRLTTRTYLAAVCVTYVIAPVLGCLLPLGLEPAEGFALGLLAYYLVWVAWIFHAAILWTRTVRSSTVTTRGPRMAGVHAAFVAALREDRARDADPARLPWGGDERDDYDDPAD